MWVPVRHVTLNWLERDVYKVWLPVGNAIIKTHYMTREQHILSLLKSFLISPWTVSTSSVQTDQGCMTSITPSAVLVSLTCFLCLPSSYIKVNGNIRICFPKKVRNSDRQEGQLSLAGFIWLRLSFTLLLVCSHAIMLTSVSLSISVSQFLSLVPLLSPIASLFLSSLSSLIFLCFFYSPLSLSQYQPLVLFTAV